MLDEKDIVYLVAGLALLGLTALPLVCGKRLLSVPTLYVAAGAVLAFTPFALHIPDPNSSEVAGLVIEHLTELIVIIALAAAGLAVDRQAGRREWAHSWVLLGVAMPLTIVGLYFLGVWAGLPMAAALLLGAALAPTDPVLAREVQVSGPNEGDEDDVRVSLTTEAGLNDGLAFPFVWLAIAVASAQAATIGPALAETGVDWLLYDVGWRIAAALAMGGLVGWASARFVMGAWGDARAGGANAGLVFLGSTCLVYGLTEAIEGYGFLAVFVAARVGRNASRGSENEGYVAQPHAYADQCEKILLAVLLLWVGGYVVSGVLDALTWREVAVAFLLVFVLRPAIGYLALLCTRGDRFRRLSIAFFGIRGMGSFFYIAFAASHGTFDDLTAVWRITIVTVLLSIAVHGALAPIAMRRIAQSRDQKTAAAE